MRQLVKILDGSIMKKLIDNIEKYLPVNAQEQNDKIEILKWLKGNEECLTRKNQKAHLTTSAWVVNPERTKVIMAYHKIYDSWAWLGGHADGESDLLKVALKEAKEEAGIKNVKAVSEDIFSLEILAVAGHEKKGQWIPSHVHLNVTYLLEADENQALVHCEEENSDVKWLTFEEVQDFSSEPWMVNHIYKKLIEKSK